MLVFCLRYLQTPQTPLSGSISRGKVRVVFGARQTGKTELLRHLLPPDRVRFFNLQEHWVAQELLARAGYSGRAHRVSSWRTTGGAEVDFVWETPGEDMPIEVKWTERPPPVDARHLETFLVEYPERARRGLLVCRCEQPQQLTGRVRAEAIMITSFVLPCSR